MLDWVNRGKNKTEPEFSLLAWMRAQGMCKDRSLAFSLSLSLGRRNSLIKYMFNYAKWFRNGAVWLIVIVFLMNELPFLKESK